MPNGARIFVTEDERMYYPENIANQMWENHYEVYLDGRPWPDPSRKGRWKEVGESPVTKPAAPETGAAEAKEKPSSENTAQEEKPKRGRRKKTAEEQTDVLEGQTSMF